MGTCCSLVAATSIAQSMYCTEVFDSLLNGLQHWNLPLDHGRSVNNHDDGLQLRHLDGAPEVVVSERADLVLAPCPARCHASSRCTTSSSVIDSPSVLLLLASGCFS